MIPTKTRAALATALTLVLGAAGQPLSAAFTYTTIDHPLAGPGGTVPQDVEGSLIVGTFLDAAAVSHGFIYDGRTWTTLDAPAAAAPRGTGAYGVSNGTVSGTFVDASGQTFGFLYDGTSWTALEHPSIGVGRVDTVARGISDGTVVGYAIESLAARGFVYRGGAFREVIVPGSIGTFPQDVDGDRIVGTFDDPLTRGFLLDGNALQVIDHPLGLPLGTFLTGVDGANIVGNYLSATDGRSHGFLFDGTNYIPIDVPGATDTAATGIDGTRIVGTYLDAAGATHGFVATIPEPSWAAGALVALALAPLVRRRRRNAAGPRAGAAAAGG